MVCLYLLTASRKHFHFSKFGKSGEDSMVWADSDRAGEIGVAEFAGSLKEGMRVMEVSSNPTSRFAPERQF